MADRKITDLTALTSPATGDLLPIVDVSEAADADKNKSITYSVLFRNLPDGTAGAPSVGFLSDIGTTGLYRPAANELGVSANSSFIGKFTANGLKLGGGATDATDAQLHLVSSDTTDQVIIENTDAGLDTAPDLVLYRNSASPAANDTLGNLEFRGEDDGGNTVAYAQITAGIDAATDGAETGILDLISSDAGSASSRLRLRGAFVGINETNPDYRLHVTESTAGNALQLECTANDAASGGDITLYHHRNGAAGQDDDVISSLFFRGNNDNASPQDLDYASIEGSILDASDTTEDGRLKFNLVADGSFLTKLTLEPTLLTFANSLDIAFDTLTGTKIGTGTTQKLSFWDATPVVQPSAIADLTVTATTGTLPTPDGSVTIADAASPTNAELLEYCTELEAKLEAALAHLRTLGLIAT